MVGRYLCQDVLVASLALTSTHELGFNKGKSATKSHQLHYEVIMTHPTYAYVNNIAKSVIIKSKKKSSFSEI